MGSRISRETWVEWVVQVIEGGTTKVWPELLLHFRRLENELT